MKKIFISSLIAMAVIVFIVVIYINHVMHKPIEVQTEQTFFIKPGTTLTTVAKKLQAEGIIQSAMIFKLYARTLYPNQSLKAGEYRLSPNMSQWALLQKMLKGEVITYTITLIEGWTYAQILAELKQHPKLIQTLSQKSEKDILALLGSQENSLEGIFFADSYQYIAGMQDIDILTRAHKKLQTVLNTYWSQKSANLPYKNPYQALIMASIIEKETGIAEERAQIAGVFIRRLKKGMRLQSDPTVIYGVGDGFDGNLTRDHLNTLTPYNTYQMSGLPPTPIAIVGEAAIKAALNPTQGDTLYFVSMGNGRHYFSKTLDEHNKAVQRYQLKRGSP